MYEDDNWFSIFFGFVSGVIIRQDYFIPVNPGWKTICLFGPQTAPPVSGNPEFLHGRNHVKILTLSVAPLTLCPRRYGNPRNAIVTYFLLRDYPDCTPSPNGDIESHQRWDTRRIQRILRVWWRKRGALGHTNRFSPEEEFSFSKYRCKKNNQSEFCKNIVGTIPHQPRIIFVSPGSWIAAAGQRSIRISSKADGILKDTWSLLLICMQFMSIRCWLRILFRFREKNTKMGVPEKTGLREWCVPSP